MEFDQITVEEVKRVCDTVLDIRSQCLLSRHLQRVNAMYCQNVLLKINVKLGGTNAVLQRSPSVALLLDKPAIVMGADVTHPSPQSDLPSIAAVVASMDRFACQFATQTRVQSARKEIIVDLQAITMEHLRLFYRVTRQKPEKILFYRDGVGNAQLSQVISQEIRAIQQACDSLEKGYAPKITFVVVQKRHHVRLFTTSNRDQDRSGNVPAGTIVDTTITAPVLFDFFLVAHAGIQGTSRPTHYQVVWDDNGFSSDLLQDLTNRMCYTYARCMRSVSVVPAAYYAHWAANRARCHSDHRQVTAPLTRVLPVRCRC